MTFPNTLGSYGNFDNTIFSGRGGISLLCGVDKTNCNHGCSLLIFVATDCFAKARKNTSCLFNSGDERVFLELDKIFINEMF